MPEVCEDNTGKLVWIEGTIDDNCASLLEVCRDSVAKLRWIDDNCVGPFGILGVCRDDTGKFVLIDDSNDDDCKGPIDALGTRRDDIEDARREVSIDTLEMCNEGTGKLGWIDCKTEDNWDPTAPTDALGTCRDVTPKLVRVEDVADGRREDSIDAPECEDDTGKLVSIDRSKEEICEGPVDALGTCGDDTAGKLV